ILRDYQKTTRKVFTPSGAEVFKSNNLIQGICLLNGFPTLRFQSYSFFHIVCLHVLIEITHVFLDCPLTVLDRKSLIDFICLSLSQFRCYSWHGLKLVVSKVGRFITTNQVEASLKENTQVCMMLPSLKIENKVIVSDMLIMRNFLEVFLKDVSELSLERKIDFSVHLVLGIEHISTTLYRMSPLA
ncbi:hypothetical protein CR513_12877, partial [Mucuna pruriens]